MGYGRESFMLVGPGSCPECQINQLMVSVMIRRNMDLSTDLLSFTLQLRKTSVRRPSDEGCAISHYLKCSPFPPNEVSRIAQYVRNGKGRKGQDGINTVEVPRLISRSILPILAAEHQNSWLSVCFSV